jgi:cytidine deaminase
MDMDFKMLFDVASKLAGKKTLTDYAHYGKVASALITDKGNVYSGISLVTDCGGFCAENGAILEMLKNNESKIKKIIAVSNNEVRPLCGRCREIIRMIDDNNMKTEVMVDEKEIKTIEELIPYAWKHN